MCNYQLPGFPALCCVCGWVISDPQDKGCKQNVVRQRLNSILEVQAKSLWPCVCEQNKIKEKENTHLIFVRLIQLRKIKWFFFGTWLFGGKSEKKGGNTNTNQCIRPVPFRIVSRATPTLKSPLTLTASLFLVCTWIHSQIYKCFFCWARRHRGVVIGGWISARAADQLPDASDQLVAQLLLFLTCPVVHRCCRPTLSWSDMIGAPWKALHLLHKG